ncbi:MAG: glycosyltransferase family 39 protein [Planctomycetota bacterium]
MNTAKALLDRPSPLLMAGMGLLLVLVLLHGTGVSPELGDLGGDSAEYVLLARSLAGGHGYRDLYLPGAPAHTQYPFGWPLLLAPLQWLPGDGFLAAHLLTLALFGFALWLTFVWIRGELGAGAAWAAVALLGFSPALLEASGQLRSELPALVFGLLTLCALQRYAQADSWKHRSGLLAALFAAAAVLIRTASAPFAVGGALYLLAGRAQGSRTQAELSRPPIRARLVKAGFFLVLAGLPVLGWMIRNRLLGGTGSSYFDQLLLAELYTHDAGQLDASGLLQRITENVAQYWQLSGWLILSPAVKLAPWGLYWLGVPAILAAIGFVVRFWYRRGPAEWILPLYLLVILAWPWTGVRFLVPVAPLIVFYAIAGTQWAIAPLFRRQASLRRFGLPAIAILASIGNASECWPYVSSRVTPAPYINDRIEIDFSGFSEQVLWRQQRLTEAAHAAWGRYLTLGVDAQRSGGGTVLCRKPRLTALLCGIGTTGIPLEPDPDRFLEEAQRQGVRFVLVDELGGLSSEYVKPAIEARPEQFQLISRRGASALYELRPRLTASPK